jgi:hypothetical protein
MNLLQLANDFILESESLNPVGSVQGQDFDLQQLVTWIRDAWIDIQSSRLWDFRWAEGSFQTVASKGSYSPMDLGLDPEADLKQDYLFIQSDSAFLGKVKFYPYDKLKHKIRQYPREGKPDYATVLPNGYLTLYPTPAEALTINFEYYKEPQFLIQDNDEPRFPQRHHKIITWKALEHYAREQGAEWQGLYQAAIRNYNKEYSKMLNNETSQIYIQKEFHA